MIDTSEEMADAPERSLGAIITRKYGVAEIQSEVVRYIKMLVLTSPPPPSHCLHTGYSPRDHYPLWINTKHVTSAALLPRGHPVRRTLAAVSTIPFLNGSSFKFASGTQDHPTSGADLIHEVREALTLLDLSSDGPTFIDPKNETT
ncbi:hypothetical protein N7457_003567 [Penicillium paradoxum]|uniref:uncharacterized protein n=1 Tax=Penicillium paradoxum TaxID=176176 RepID=UPI0025471BD8|nr:uncharacterized protein N7457_003567 [Penicillium paradoxum]KAJ5788577.1 hypothetical protein N7457_003567 [Penicillium paradoxum]